MTENNYNNNFKARYWTTAGEMEQRLGVILDGTIEIFSPGSRKCGSKIQDDKIVFTNIWCHFRGNVLMWQASKIWRIVVLQNVNLKIEIFPS